MVSRSACPGSPGICGSIRFPVFLLAVVGLLVAVIALYAPGYLREFTHGKGKQPLAPLGLFTGLFVFGMMLVLLADDAFVFMIAWELMSVSSYFLVAYQHQHAANRRAAFLYLLMAHIGGLAILLGFGVLAGFGDGFTFAAMRAADLSVTWASIAFAFAFFGFGMKAGMVPVHAWLPEAHPVAPSHISALMSGVMLKVALYGLIRFTYDLLGDIQWQWGRGRAPDRRRLDAARRAVRADAARSQAPAGLPLGGEHRHHPHRARPVHDLPRHGSPGRRHPRPARGPLPHAEPRGVQGPAVPRRGRDPARHARDDLNNMGGLIHRMPQTAVFFLIGCLAISGLPPLNGFVSEWLTLQAALQAPALESGVLRALIPVTAAVLALSAALAAACFVKVYGVAFLGDGAQRRVAHAREVDVGMRLAMGTLALLCLLFGVFPNTVIGALDAVPQMLVHAARAT